jgi:hypothetical protein
MCQHCADERCRLCLPRSCRKKLSIAEQILRYEILNASAPQKTCPNRPAQIDIPRKP